jgi:hypothetical protein
MDYQHITSFFEKFKKIIFQKNQIKEIVIKNISEIISYQIKDNWIDIKKNEVNLKTSPLLKNEILIHKKEILEKINQELPVDFKIINIK